MTVLNAPQTTAVEPPEPPAPERPADDRPIVVMIVANAFCRDDGWHDIRVHKFAKTFEEQGLRPIVFCRTHGDATEPAGIYDGIEYRRMLFKAPKLPPAEVERPVVVEAPPEPGPTQAPQPPKPSAIERLILWVDPGPRDGPTRPVSAFVPYNDRPAPGRWVAKARARFWYTCVPRALRGPIRRRWTRATNAAWHFAHDPVTITHRLPRLIAVKGLRCTQRLGRRIMTAARRMRNRLRTLIRRTAQFVRVRIRRARTAARRIMAMGPRARRRFNTTYLNFLNIDFTEAVLDATRGVSPTFVYAADLNCLRAGFRVSRRAGVPFLYDSHEYFLSRAEHEWMHWTRRNVDRWLCRRLEHGHFGEIETTVGVSESIVNAFRDRVPGGSYLCVRNLPINESGPPPIERSSIIIDQLGLDPSTKIALYIGFVTGGRGITELIESAQYLPDGVVIALLGGGRQLEEQQARARSLGVEHKVHFLGHVPQSEVLTYAAGADCGVSLIQPTCLSYEWSLPNKIFQYIHAGLPVLCSDFPDMGDVVRRWDVGATVDPSDPSKIAAAIEALVSDPASLARMRANCRAAVEEELNWDRERQKILSIGFVRDAVASAT